MAGAVASVLALGAIAPAFADNDHRGRDRDRREWREDRREWRHDRRDWERDRREARRDYRHDRRYDHGYYRPAPPPPRVVYSPGYRPGYGYGWQRGGRFSEGTPNYAVLKEWNKSAVYQKTIAVFASRLMGLQ